MVLYTLRASRTALFGEINVAEETPSSQDNVRSQCCKRNRVVGGNKLSQRYH
ncbi:hypothetical protein SCLCIDRAFT_1212892 [Scleroderma citrinum Foug A]|uniref:Uncharacterized protein n=1 Tax=Scleroderma citrinum Foug A TaxID=1036808 RepID=A0A0C3E9Z4_9AGAM|nr:hypothetical protein SCLCIDRAFT_1212892 [Scleroderma citrinum Foug A]